MRRNVVRTLLWAAVAGAVIPATLRAQDGAPAKVTGRVTSEQGAPLAAVQIVVSNPATGTTKSVVSGSDGRYAVEGLRPANGYRVQASRVGSRTETVNGVQLSAGATREVNFVLASEALILDALEIVAERAVERKTPVAHTTVEKAVITRALGSRDIPMVLNTTPGVYATETGGGAGDSRINVRGFNQRNVAVMINGVPVNDMENGWVYWSNWDGLGDATSSIQVQRGVGASNLAVPSIGGTMNILTDAAAIQKGVHFKQELGTGDFRKSTFSAHTGLLNNRFAASFVGVRKTGNGQAAQTWTDSYAYFGALSYQLNDQHRLQAFLVGAPQQHGQRRTMLSIASWDAGYAAKLGVDTAGVKSYGALYNSGYGFIADDATGLDEFYNGGVRGVRRRGVLDENVNFYHKPQANLNWYWDISDRLSLTNVAYVSIGRGGGSGLLSNPRTNLKRDAGGLYNWQEVYQGNSTRIDPTYSTTETRSNLILRNSVNRHDWYGWVGTLKYDLTDNFKLTTGVDARYYKGEHYREVRNLVGGDYFIDTADKNQTSAVKRLGDKIGYHDDGLVRWYGGFGQLEGTFGKLTTISSFSLSRTDYKRVDYFVQRGADGNPAETDWIDFGGYKLAGGANYNLTDAINVFGNVGYISKAPSHGSVFSSYTNTPASGISNEEITSFELGAGYRTGQFAANLNVYNTLWADRNTTQRFTIDGQQFTAFVRGIDALHRGVELDLRYKPLDLVEFNGAVSVGDWRWRNDAKATVANDDNPTATTTIEVFAKDLKVGDAAQTQFALSTQVNPVEGAWVNLTAKHFADYYAEFEPVYRTNAEDREQSWKIPAYTLLDLGAGYALPYRLPRGAKIEARLNVFNLLDETYISDARDGNAHDAASARVFFGLPRRVNLGMDIRF